MIGKMKLFHVPLLLGGAWFCVGCQMLHDRFFDDYCTNQNIQAPSVDSKSRFALESLVKAFGINPVGKTEDDLKTDLSIIANSVSPYSGPLLNTSQLDHLSVMVDEEDLVVIRSMQTYLENLKGKKVLVYERND